MMWGGYGWFGMIWMAILWVSVVVLVAWAVTRLTRSSSGHDRAEEILKERFARGDIATEEFETRRRELQRL